MKIEQLEFETENGETIAYAAKPDEISPDTKAVILIHEWWGLNENIKNIAQRYADNGFIAIAPDLYRGTIAKDSDKAAKLMNDLAIEDGIDTIKCAIAKGYGSYKISHYGITGYCMGGTYALRAACELDEINAAVPYYGDTPPEEVLKDLSTPVLFISGKKDDWINPEKVAELMADAEKYDLPIESKPYEADHAFANETNLEVYNKEAAEDAWKRTLEFFNNNL